MSGSEDPEEVASRRGRTGVETARARIMRKPERPLLERVRSQAKAAKARYARMSPAERETFRSRVAGGSPYITFVGKRAPGASRLDKHGHRLLTQQFTRRDWRTRPPRG